MPAEPKVVKKVLQVPDGTRTLAQVKKGSRWNVITACGGREFIKGQERQVPVGQEAEAAANPFLDVRTVELFREEEVLVEAGAKGLEKAEEVQPEKELVEEPEAKPEGEADEKPAKRGKKAKPEGEAE